MATVKNFGGPGWPRTRPPVNFSNHHLTRQRSSLTHLGIGFVKHGAVILREGRKSELEMKVPPPSHTAGP